MSNRRLLTPVVFSLVAAFGVVAIGAARAAFADPTEGRPSAQVPVNANSAQAAGEAGGNGTFYETQRIKRTVPLDAGGGLQGRWDPLYAVQDGSGGLRTTYLDWDDTYLYIGVETARPVETRIDIDGQNDGWLHGADNLSIDVIPAPDGSANGPKVSAQRFDMVQNRETPVWAGSPIAPGDIKASGGKTPRGTYAILLAIPHTETIGLSLKPGSSFGVRVDSGTLTPIASEAITIPVRPMLRVSLSEAVPASNEGLDVKLTVNGPHDITPGGDIRTTLEIKNNSQSKKRLSRLYIRGSLSSTDFVDESKFAGADIEPGQTIKRDLRSALAPAAPVGSVALSGGGDLDDGSSVVALAAVNKVEPYAVWVETDGKPIPASGDKGDDPVRTASAFVRSRVNQHTTATIELKLPDGWKTLDKTPSTLTRTLVRDGDVQLAKFQFVVPASAKLGPHTIGISVSVGGHTYTGETTVVIAQ